MPKPDVLSLEQKIARYERIKAMRGSEDAPKMSLEDIGAQFDPPLTRQRVAQIITSGRPDRPGRPRSEAKMEAARQTLALWEERRANRQAKGLDTSYAEARIEALSRELADAVSG